MENRQGNERASHDLMAETPEPGARPGNVSEPIGDSTVLETPFEDTWPSIPGAKPTPLHEVSSGSWRRRLRLEAGVAIESGGESSNTRNSDQSVSLPFGATHARPPNESLNSSRSKNANTAATNKQSDEPNGKENNEVTPTGSSMETARKERPFLRGRWYCECEGCGFHNSTMNVSCCYCGTSRDRAATVADSALLSPFEPPSGHGKGSPSLAETPGPGPLAAASTLLSNQGPTVDKDDNTSSTTQLSRRLSEGEINTPADPPGSDTSEREGSLDDGAQQQASIASEDDTFTTASARDTESEAFHSAFGSPQPSPQAKVPVPVEGIECSLPSISLNETPRPATPTPVESTGKYKSQIESQIESERVPDHRLAGMEYPKSHVRLPSSPAAPPATEQKQSFSAQAPEFVPSPAPSLTATPTNVRSPDHPQQPSIDTLGPSGIESTCNLSRGHLNE